MNTYKPEDILKRVSAIGTYYGFTPLSTLSLKKGISKSPYPDSVAFDTLDTNTKDIVNILKHVRDIGITPSSAQPLFVWHTNAAQGRPAPKQLVIQFHAMGTDRSIADAVLLRAVHALMQDLHKDDLFLRINSMGDKETVTRFVRELVNFFRKNPHLFPREKSLGTRKDVLTCALELLKKNEHHLPSPTDNLSEQSRKHFEAVIEYLELTDTPYLLAPEIQSHDAHWTETCFEIETNSKKCSAWGSRYGELSKPFFKSVVPSIGAIIRIDSDTREIILPKKAPLAPRFMFVHIGDEAKRESMKLADSLRKARIPLSQSIGIESLTEQMRFVETLNPPYILIMGRKEALERSVILRNRNTYTEVSIQLDNLVEHLKTVV
jgi:histidyl-tRNA synthetase